MKTCSVLKQRGCATREVYGNRRVDSRKRDKEQMCPFDTGTELCRVDDNPTLPLPELRTSSRRQHVSAASRLAVAAQIAHKSKV
jgi:hypothetical protein